jgi:hypothetical protein
MFMFAAHTTFVGVDPTAGRRPFTYAAVQDDLHVIALGRGNINDVLAFAGGLQQAVVAVNAPQRPNQRLMERPEIREQLSPAPRPGRWSNFRLVEYLLRQHRISCHRTASAEEDCPKWMQVGFTFYRRLAGLGYVSYPQEAPLQWIEVYPHASFTVLLEQIPFPKSSLEGRLQRQLILFENRLHIPDPMAFFEEITRYRLLNGALPKMIYEPCELDALVAAYVAWCVVHRSDQTSFVGDAEEGQIALPIPELKRKYTNRRITSPP